MSEEPKKDPVETGNPEDTPDAPVSESTPEATTVPADAIIPEAPKEPELEYAKFEDPTLDSIATIFEDAKINPVEVDKIFAEAIQSHDLSKIDFDKVKDLLGDKKSTIVKELVQVYKSKLEAEVAKGKQIAFEVFGGEQGLAQLQKWVQAKELADPVFKNELVSYRNLLNSKDPTTVKLVLTQLKQLKDADTTQTVGDPNLVQGTTGKPAAGQGLTAQQFNDAVYKAYRNNTYSKVIDTLRSQRELGKKQGI